MPQAELTSVRNNLLNDRVVASKYSHADLLLVLARAFSID
jgi:hypothetical protein